MGADELPEHLCRTADRAAPPAGYRARDLRGELRSMHKLERPSAVGGCVGRDNDLAARFPICRSCGQVVGDRLTGIEDHQPAHALNAATEGMTFTVARATIAAAGQCAACTTTH